MRAFLLDLYVWAACLVPTRDELRVGLLTGAGVFLVAVVSAPLWRPLLGF